MLDFDVSLPATVLPPAGEVAAEQGCVRTYSGDLLGEQTNTKHLLCERILSTKIDVTGLSKSRGVFSDYIKMR